MDWKECLDGDVVRVSPNRETAKSLLGLCEARLDSVKGMKKYPALVAETYYEVMKELLTALLALHGFKSYSHVCLIAFAKAHYPSEFKPHDIEIMDKLRRIRNDLEYRGVFAGEDFLARNMPVIIAITMRLKLLVEKMLEKRN